MKDEGSPRKVPESGKVKGFGVLLWHLIGPFRTRRWAR